MTTRIQTAPPVAEAPAAGIPAQIATDFDYKRAFQDLEDLVNRTSMATRLASYLAHEDMGLLKDRQIVLTEAQADFIQFTASVAEDYAGQLHDRWLEGANESARKERVAVDGSTPEAAR